MNEFGEQVGTDPSEYLQSCELVGGALGRVLETHELAVMSVLWRGGVNTPRWHDAIADATVAGPSFDALTLRAIALTAHAELMG